VGAGWEIRELTTAPSVATTDTIDASGLFIHTASPFERAQPTTVGSPPYLVARTGPGVGDPAVALIGVPGGAPWQPVSLEDNYPAGPPDPHVGCYAVEVGPWDNPRIASTHPPELLPPVIRLHWQHAWHVGGRERALVATDGDGRIPGRETTAYYWRRTAADSIRITFGTSFRGTSYRLTAKDADLTGEVRRSGDTVPGPTATASVRLRRRTC
jgi:hypothetical protein